MPRPSLIARALVLALVALAPLLALTTGTGISPGYTAADASAHTPDQMVAIVHPDSVFTVDSAASQLAIQIAKANWGGDPCGGQVTVAWGPLDSDVNAQSSWTNPRSAYDNPELNGDCKVTFNPTAGFDWAKFCTVMVHEYGHLGGRPHAANPNDVMAAYYTVALPACVAATPAEFKPAAAAAPTAAPKAPVAAAQAKVARTTVRPSPKPATVKPTTVKPTTVKPTTVKPTTVKPTTVKPTTVKKTTVKKTSVKKTSVKKRSRARKHRTH